MTPSCVLCVLCVCCFCPSLRQKRAVNLGGGHVGLFCVRSLFLSPSSLKWSLNRAARPPLTPRKRARILRWTATIDMPPSDRVGRSSFTKLNNFTRPTPPVNNRKKPSRPTKSSCFSGPPPPLVRGCRMGWTDVTTFLFVFLLFVFLSLSAAIRQRRRPCATRTIRPLPLLWLL